MPGPAEENPKAALRHRMREVLKGVAGTEGSERIRAHLAVWMAERAVYGLKVASFAALPGEVDLLPLICAIPSVRWCFPRVIGNNLRFSMVEHESDLIPGALGIREPLIEAAGIAPGLIDVFLVPGLAFDLSTGARLGRGRGYYDRSLALANRNAFLIGVGFSCQMTRVPTEPHDRSMDAIICESGWHWVKNT